MLDKFGNTQFQRKISNIIKTELRTKRFNRRQYESILTIWGLSLQRERQRGPRQINLLRGLTGINVVPSVGMIPEGLTYENEDIPHSYQSFSCVVVIGPPGTGKTTVIVNGSLLFISDPQYRRSNPVVFIGTPNNASADRILEGFHAFFERNDVNDGFHYVKRTFPFKPLQDYPEHLRPYVVEKNRPNNYEEEEYKMMISTAWIHIGTCYALHRLARKGYSRPQIILFDEASQLTPPLFYLPFDFPRSSIRGCCIVGDNCQLPPITTYTELSVNSIDFAISNLPFRQQNVPQSRQLTLEIQYRMHPAIRDLSVKFALGRHNIKDGGETTQESYLLQNFSPYYGSQANIINEILNPIKTIVILDTTQINAGEILNRRQGRSRFNLGEINIIHGLFKLISDHYPSSEANLDYLKMISPYRAQANRLKSVFFKAGTADMFQGQEADLVIISLTLTDNIPSPHIRDYNRLHVMFSRAKKKMIIIGRKSTFESYETQARHIQDVFNYSYQHNDQNPDLGYDPVFKHQINDELYNFFINY